MSYIVIKKRSTCIEQLYQREIRRQLKVLRICKEEKLFCHEMNSNKAYSNKAKYKTRQI